MRADYAEERRWKRVLAREFAYQAVEWHLSSPEEKLKLMVGGRGWGESRDLPIPGHFGERCMGSFALAAGSPEEDEGMPVFQSQRQRSNATEQSGEDMNETGAEVLEDIFPRHDEEGRSGEGAMKSPSLLAEENDADHDEEMPEDIDADGEEDAEGEPDAGDTTERLHDKDVRGGENAGAKAAASRDVPEMAADNNIGLEGMSEKVGTSADEKTYH